MARTMLAVYVLMLSLALPLLADRIEQSVKDAPPSGLRAGAARTDIAPPAGMVHLNWGAQTHIAGERVDPMGLWATALVLSDGRQRFAIVDIDRLSPEGLDGAVARAAAQTGIPAAHIRVTATHTHAGPMFSAVRGPAGADLTAYEKQFAAYREFLEKRIVEAVVKANANLSPAHLGAARGAGTINNNRRVRAAGTGRPAAVGLNPEGFVDRDLVVARIDDAGGRTVAVLVNFQCHGTVLAHENRVLSPDWPGMMRKVVEQAFPGALCLFQQGAAGNQGPVEGLTGDLSVAHRLGARLGHEAAALALGIETVQRAPRFEGFTESTAFLAKQPWRVAGPKDGTLKFASTVAEIPRRRYGASDLEWMRGQVREAQDLVARAEASKDEWRVYQAKARLRRVENLLKQWNAPVDPSPVKVLLQALRVGELSIAAMPGEPFAEVGVAVKRASPFPVAMFGGYSSGAGGDYMPIASEYEHGGYEVERTPYAPEAAAAVIKELTALYQRLN